MSLILEVSADSAGNGTDLALGSLPDSIVQLPEYSTFSLQTAGVLGQPTANHYAWVATNRYNWTACSKGCSTDWINYRITTDPGQTGTRSSVVLTTWGNSFIGKKFDLTSRIYSNTILISTHSWLWNAPGTVTHWNNPHSSTLNKPFLAYYVIKIPKPGGGTATSEYKTKTSNRCVNGPSGGAYRCYFP